MVKLKMFDVTTIQLKYVYVLSRHHFWNEDREDIYRMGIFSSPEKAFETETRPGWVKEDEDTWFLDLHPSRDFMRLKRVELDIEE